MSTNPKSGLSWGSVGVRYDLISQGLSDAIEHCLSYLNVQLGDHVLDIATGTGWTARQLAQKGIRVTAIDFSPELIDAAQELSKKEKLKIDFHVGDGESLSFDNHSFDQVVSTFGIIFCHNPDAAIREMVRVCKPSAQIVLTSWSDVGPVFDVFEIIKKFSPRPPTITKGHHSFSPFSWGNTEWVRKIMKPYFDIQIHKGISMQKAKSVEILWDFVTTCYGPMKALTQSLDQEKLKGLKSDYVQYHQQYCTEEGVAVPREYLIITGQRR